MSKKFSGLLMVISVLLLTVIATAGQGTVPNLVVKPQSEHIAAYLCAPDYYIVEITYEEPGVVFPESPFSATATVNGVTYTGGVAPMFNQVVFDDVYLQVGDTMQIALDTDQEITESDETDNTYSMTFTAPDTPPSSPDNPNCGTGLPDLKVNYIYARDCSHGLFLDVFNGGSSALRETATVTITVDGQQYTKKTSLPLPYSRDVLWFDAPMSYNAVSVVIDEAGDVEESDETNNSYTGTIQYYGCTEATPVPRPEELLENGDFELGETRLASDWKSHNLKQNDYRVCDAGAFAGQCAFQFKGASSQPRILLQNIKPNISSGTLKFSGWVETTNLERGAKLIMIVRYQDGTRERVVVRPALNTTPYTQFNEYHAVRGAVASVKVQVKAAQGGGLFRVDDLSVRWIE